MDTIQELVGRIRLGEKDQQVSAVRELGDRGGRKAVKPLIDILENSLNNYEKRYLIYAIVETLGRLGSLQAEQALLKAVENPFYDIKEAAVESLKEIHSGKKETVKYGRPEHGHANRISGTVMNKNQDSSQGPEKDGVIRALTAYYHSEADQKLRLEIIKALARIASSGSIRFLISALTEDNADIRACAASALGETGDRSAIPSLRKLLTDPQENVMRCAAQALGLITFTPAGRLA